MTIEKHDFLDNDPIERDDHTDPDTGVVEDAANSHDAANDISVAEPNMETPNSTNEQNAEPIETSSTDGSRSRKRWIAGSIGAATVFGLTLGLSLKEDDEANSRTSQTTPTPITASLELDDLLPSSTLPESGVVIKVSNATEPGSYNSGEITITTTPVVMDSRENYSQLLHQYDSNRMCALNANELSVANDCITYMAGDDLADNLVILREEAISSIRIRREEDLEFKPNRSSTAIDSKLSPNGTELEFIVAVNYTGSASGTPYEYLNFEWIDDDRATSSSGGRWLLREIMYLIDGQQSFEAIGK